MLGSFKNRVFFLISIFPSLFFLVNLETLFFFYLHYIYIMDALGDKMSRVRYKSKAKHSNAKQGVYDETNPKTQPN